MRASSWSTSSIVARVVATLALLPTLVLGTGAASAAGDGPPSSRGTVTSSAPYLMPLEPYAGYQPQTRCQRWPKAGVLMLADWLVARGGGYGEISRSCAGSSISEHKESRAFDWVLDARSEADRAVAAALLDEILAPDDTGQPSALARRMGIMYVIWNDQMYASYDEFVAKKYLSSSCRNRRSCSPTLRHQDHVHLSLTRQGAKGLTSWYVAQPPAA